METEIYSGDICEALMKVCSWICICKSRCSGTNCREKE